MKSILLVEDESEVANVIAEFLRAKGYTVRVCANGLIGLQALREERPDLVITDRVMPEMSGTELLRNIREKMPELDSMPVIILTALRDRRDQFATADLHPTRYLKKPIELAVLAEEVKACLDEEAGK